MLAGMTLREALASGEAGVRWSAPASLAWREGSPVVAVADDATFGVTWFVRRMPWPIDLRPAHDEALRGDFEADARRDFEAAFRPPAEGDTFGRKEPRTADPAWSPIVDFEPVQVDGARALRVVRRLAYQPGNEVLSGALLAPLASGYVEFAALCRAGTTGMRESVLLAKQRVTGGDGEGKFPPQSAYDDPALDAVFADHPLSRVRAALRWLLGEAGLRVTAPAAVVPVGEVVLDEPGCAVVPPPRFLHVPRSVMAMSPTLGSMARVTFTDRAPQLLDVWRHPSRFTGGDRAARLLSLARESTAAWVGEGVTDLAHGPAAVPGDGAAVVVEDVARFKVKGAPKVSALRWRVDPDGTVFRVSAGGVQSVDDGTVVDRARAVRASLRRLDPR